MKVKEMPTSQKKFIVILIMVILFVIMPLLAEATKAAGMDGVAEVAIFLLDFLVVGGLILLCSLFWFIVRRQEKKGTNASSSEGFKTRELEIPEGHKFSISEAAQAIGVTRGILRGYIKSGRINTNSDKSIDAAELLRAGFIIRTLPPRSG